jgi:hypothetical protein
MRGKEGNQEECSKPLFAPNPNSWSSPLGTFLANFILIDHHRHAATSSEDPSSTEETKSALEEAEFEDEGGKEGALEREMQSQCTRLVSFSLLQVCSMSSSYANPPSVQTSSGHSWSSWNEPRVHWCSCLTSSRRLAWSLAPS